MINTLNVYRQGVYKHIKERPLLSHALNRINPFVGKETPTTNNSPNELELLAF